jgi:D-amino-acid dehydrogenase
MIQLEPVVPPESFLARRRQAGGLPHPQGLRSGHRQIRPSSTPRSGARPNARPTSRRWPRRKDKLEGGIYNSGEAVADCYAFCVALAERIAAHPRFSGFVHGDALRRFSPRRPDHRPGNQHRPAESRRLRAGGRHAEPRAGRPRAGISLPIYPLKGYSLTAPIRPEDVAPEISVTDFERKVLYARIGGNLRVAAMVDMVGEDLSLDAPPPGQPDAPGPRTMPHAADYNSVTPWAGLRPATPNSAPIVGATPYSNLWLNIGHGPLGFTFACGTASVLAGCLTHSRIEHHAIRRFGCRQTGAVDIEGAMLMSGINQIGPRYFSVQNIAF